MTVAALPPNPSLIAIILVVRARSGPRLVYHYPPSPGSRSASQKVEDTQLSYGDSSSSGAESTTTSDNDGRSDGRADFTDEEDENSSSPGTNDEEYGKRRVPWENLLGLDASALERLLMPSDRSWHKRRFEVGFNELVFVGWPIFIREDGTWKKKRRNEQSSSEQARNAVDHSRELSPRTKRDTRYQADQRVKSDVTSSGGTNAESTQSEESREMTIFNVVFVLNPPILEYTVRVKEMYDHVVKKLGKALKCEQARANYVWKQSEIILRAKAQARHKSPLACSFSRLMYAELEARNLDFNPLCHSSTKLVSCRCISNSLQQHISLYDCICLSHAYRLYIIANTPTTSTSILPCNTDPPSARTQPGVWLTTATAESSDEIASIDPNYCSMSLAKHFTLLLLDSETKILADVSQSGGPLATALAHYIRVSSPTKSFAKISAHHSISLADIQILARHLVSWRRARAIPPLHQRDIYIVSPNADMRKLSSAVKEYESAFPTLPSLPKMLQALSGIPRPYSSLIPSKDHKNAYFTILAWLLRGGWVTQLRTFAFVRVGSSLKISVKEKTRAEKHGMAQSEKSSSLETHHDTIGPLNLSKRPSMISRVSSDIRSSTSSRSNTRMNSLILQPARASPTESKWLEYIKDHFHDLLSTGLNEEEVLELQQYWPAFTRYLNGIEPLEKIPVREGLKRKFVWDLLGKLGLFESSASEAGSKRECQRRIVVGFRHW